MRLLRPGLVLVLALSGCGLFTGPDEALRLPEARALWARVGPSDYSFEYTPSCFCTLAGQRVVVTVDDGVVAGARLVGASALDASSVGSIPTIPELFDIIQDAYDRSAHQVDVSYDPTWGFPVHARIDYDAQAADEEFGFTVSGFASRELLGTGR